MILSRTLGVEKVFHPDFRVIVVSVAEEVENDVAQVELPEKQNTDTINNNIPDRKKDNIIRKNKNLNKQKRAIYTPKMFTTTFISVQCTKKDKGQTI
mgnify:CR=1 FL=1